MKILIFIQITLLVSAVLLSLSIQKTTSLYCLHYMNAKNAELGEISQQENNLKSLNNL
jgi:hypothetical protein